MSVDIRCLCGMYSSQVPEVVISGKDVANCYL